MHYLNERKSQSIHSSLAGWGKLSSGENVAGSVMSWKGTSGNVDCFFTSGRVFKNPSDGKFVLLSDYKAIIWSLA